MTPRQIRRAAERNAYLEGIRAAQATRDLIKNGMTPHKSVANAA